MKNTFEIPELEIILFTDNDVIKTSGEDEDWENNDFQSFLKIFIKIFKADLIPPFLYAFVLK